MGTAHVANTSFTQRHLLTGLVVLFGLSMLVLSNAWAAQAAPAAVSASVDTDRWLEIDLYWFRQNDIQGSVHEFWDRFQPLYAGVRGDRDHRQAVFDLQAHVAQRGLCGARVRVGQVA